MTKLIVPLIMCGGAGTRLWPASRRPTQAIPAVVRSAIDVPGHHSPRGRSGFVRTADRHHNAISLSRRQLGFAAIGVEADIILEPLRRDSGPAIAAGAAFAAKRDGDPLMVALAADHVVTDAAAFAKECGMAAASAAADRIVTFGVRPTRPATEYGYIRAGQSIGPEIFAIEKFVEKPGLQEPPEQLPRGGLSRGTPATSCSAPGLLLDEYRGFEPSSIDAVVASVDTAGKDLDFITLDAESFARATAKSIDYAVMERTASAHLVMPVAYGWSDVGSWQAVWELSGRDGSGNAGQSSGPGAVEFVDSRGSYAATDKQLVALFGVDNLVVVTTEDAVLVAKREDGDGLRRLVARLKEKAPKVTEEHLKVHRPWGAYHSIDQGARFQVKRIVVKQGGRLSLQMHHHRAEHWIVVRGTARVTINDDVKVVHENESIYIPIGARHRLENPGKIDLELIEVQTGSYLGEDDIVRIEDDYRRS